MKTSQNGYTAKKLEKLRGYTTPVDFGTGYTPLPGTETGKIIQEAFKKNPDPTVTSRPGEITIQF